jgi:hypothetical protein
MQYAITKGHDARGKIRCAVISFTGKMNDCLPGLHGPAASPVAARSFKPQRAGKIQRVEKFKGSGVFDFRCRPEKLKGSKS